MKRGDSITKIFLNSCVVATLAIVISGCASTPRVSYSGPPLPETQIARITVETKERTFWQKLNGTRPATPYMTHVDQKALGSFWGARGDSFKVVDVLPGDHSIKIVLRMPGGGLIGEAVQSSQQKSTNYVAAGYGKIINFTAQAGKKYTIKYIERRLPLVCWIVDDTTGQVVGDAKPPDAE